MGSHRRSEHLPRRTHRNSASHWQGAGRGRLHYTATYPLTLDSAELYDHELGTWAFTAPTFYERGFHTATLLLSGKVLVVGGNATRHTELYDPATGEWYATGQLNEARPAGHATALLTDGRVLVAGGVDYMGHILSSAEIYDPDTQVWTRTGDMSHGRYSLTVTVLPTGEALAVGGGGGTPDSESTAEIYDPARGTWSVTSEPFYWRYLHTASLLQDGKVLVAGGLWERTGPDPGNYSLDSCETYDPATATWEAVGRLTVARRNHTAVGLDDGRVLVAGGFSTQKAGVIVALTSCELFDPATLTWTASRGSTWPGQDTRRPFCTSRSVTSRRHSDRRRRRPRRLWSECECEDCGALLD